MKLLKGCLIVSVILLILAVVAIIVARIVIAGYLLSEIDVAFESLRNAALQ